MFQEADSAFWIILVRCLNPLNIDQNRSPFSAHFPDRDASLQRQTLRYLAVSPLDACLHARTAEYSTGPQPQHTNRLSGRQVGICHSTGTVVYQHVDHPVRVSSKVLRVWPGIAFKKTLHVGWSCCSCGYSVLPKYGECERKLLTYWSH